MGRLIDFVVLLVAIFGIYSVQFAAGATLDPLRDDLIESGIDDKYNAEENFAGMYQAVTKWVPTGLLGGLIILILWREYRRQRLAARRPI